MKFQTTNAFTFALLVLLFIVLVGVGPIITILSLNALFGTGIAVSFINWCCVVWLSLIIKGLTARTN